MPIRRGRSRAADTRRIRIDRLKQTRSTRAYIAHAQHEITRELALDLEAVRVVYGHVEIAVDDGPIHRVRIERRVLQN